MEGETKRVYLPAHQLHATEPPPEGCNTGPPDRKLLGTVPVTKVQDFLHNWHTTAGNPDLQRRKPSSGLMLELTLRTRSITDLSDDDVQALHYEAAGSRIQQDQRLQGGEQPSVPGHLLAPVAPALGSPTSPLLPSLSFSPPLPAVDKNASIAGIRIGLQKAVLGKWKHVWMCAHARKCACPFTLEFKHDGTGTVSIWQSGSHQFHDPASATDRAALKLSPEVECQILLLLENGVRPLKIRNAIYAQYKPSNAPDSSWLDFGDARFCPTLAQITALRKRMLRDQGLNLTSDPAALAGTVPKLREAGCLGFYQPFEAPCTPGGEGQALIIIVQTPFQKRMLNEFGPRLVHLDATFGTNKYVTRCTPSWCDRRAE